MDTRLVVDLGFPLRKNEISISIKVNVSSHMTVEWNTSQNNDPIPDTDAE